MKPRDYQQRAIDQLYSWMASNHGKNPCLEMPTGSGKSHIVALLCCDAVTNWPETKILMLTHVKELIEQNAEKMKQYWPNAPMGIYSASVGRKQLGEPITFGGIQSLRNKADLLGHIDLIIIDECHLVSHKNEGGYRKLISDLKEINPSLIVIGLTATPYRLGHGYITDDPAIFDEIIKPVTIEELVEAGYLANLVSKKTNFGINVDSVKKRGGEFIESDLQDHVDTDLNNATIIEETLERSEGREHWLVFCTGVAHAKKMADLLNDRGVPAACLTGENTKREREAIIRDFKSGKYRALTNANILTTGFDYPEIDLIIMARPTLSPALYVQMAGRGCRIKEGSSKDCWVFDFAENIWRHGPITNVVPRKPGPKQDPPVKPCPECDTLLPISAKVCDQCGYEFPPGESESKEIRMADDCIMGRSGSESDMEVDWWDWSVHTSRTSGKDMIKCSYYPDDLSGSVIREYLCITHEGFAGQKALATLSNIANQCNAMNVYQANDLQSVCDILNEADPPTRIQFEKNGKFFNVKRRLWEELTPTIPELIKGGCLAKSKQPTEDQPTNDKETESWLDSEPPF